MTKFSYLLYLIVCEDIDKTIFLGISDDASKLFYQGLNDVNANRDTKPYILNWLKLVEENLNRVETHDLEYAFMYNPETEFSYNIKNMTLYIKKISIF